MGDVLAGGGNELQREAARIVGIVLADPLESLGDHLELALVEVDQVAFQGGLAEDAVHETAGFLDVEIKGRLVIVAVVGQKMLPQHLARRVHPERGLVVHLDEALDLVLLADLGPQAVAFLGLDPGLVDRRDQAERDLDRRLLRRALVDLLDPVVPGSDLALLLPVGHLLLNVGQIGDHAHELRVRELLFVKGVGEVVPKLQDVARRHRPQFQRLVGGDLPARGDADHVVVVQFAFDHVAAVALFDLGNEVGLLVVELAAQLFLDDVEHRGVVEFVRRLRQVFPAVHPLHHRRILARGGDDLVFGGAGAEPAVTLKSETCAESAGLVLDATLDEQVIPENLSHGAVLLKAFAALAGFLGEAVEEIERRSVRIHYSKCEKSDVLASGTLQERRTAGREHRPRFQEPAIKTSGMLPAQECPAAARSGPAPISDRDAGSCSLLSTHCPSATRRLRCGVEASSVSGD